MRKYSPYPLFIAKGNGSRIIDSEGKEYIDYCLAFGPLILGHQNRAVIEAVRDQLEKSVLTGAPSENEILLAEKIRSAVPAMEMMRFANTGSEAVFHAIRVARAYTGRGKILKFAWSYHGAHDYNLVTADDSGRSVPSSPGVPGEVAETVLISEYGDADGLRRVFRESGQDIAAAIVEPVMANTGLIEPDVEFLRALREITSENGSLLIFDEVVTGFRMRYGCYHDSIGIRPDLVTMSKIVGGGLPLSVFGGRKEIMELIAPDGRVYVAGTFSGNPLSSAAGLAALKELEKSDYRAINRYAEEAAEAVSSAITDSGKRATVNHFGSMFQVFFARSVKSYRDSLKSDRDAYLKFFQHLLSDGIYIPSSQFETLFVSFAHTGEDFDRTVKSMTGFFRNGNI